MKKLIYALVALCVGVILFFMFNVETTDKHKATEKSIQNPIVQTVVNETKENTLKQKRVQTQVKPAIKSKPLKTDSQTPSEENSSEAIDVFGKSDLHAFKTIHPKIIKEINKIPECLMQADTKEDAFVCSKTLRALNKKLALAMGIKEKDMIDEAQYEKEFVWNEETRVKMIEEIEASQEMMQATQDCIDNADTPKALEGCFK